MREVQALVVAGMLGALAGAAEGGAAPARWSGIGATGAGPLTMSLDEWWKWATSGAEAPPPTPPTPPTTSAAQPTDPTKPTDPAQPAVPQPSVPPAPGIDQSSPPGPAPEEKPHFVHNRDSIPERPPVVFPFDGRLELETRASVGSSPASVGVSRPLAGNLVIGPEHDLQISFPVDWELSTYSFRDASAIVPGGDDRIRNVQQLVFSPNVEKKIDEHWGVFGGALLLIDAGQYGADNTTTYGGYGGVVWRPDKSLTLRLGVGARTQLDNYVDVFPALWMEWKLGERTRLTSEGYNIRFEYDISKAWTIKFDAAYEQRVFRLDSDGPAAHGVMRDYEVPLTARLEFVPHAATRFEVWVGADVDREFTVDLGKNQRFSRTHASPSLICGVSFEIIF